MTEFVFLFQLAVVFVPGLIWSSIVDRLCTNPRPRSEFSAVLRAFGFGIATYFVYFVGYYVFIRVVYGGWPTLLNGITAAPGAGELRAVRPQDVLFATLLATVLAVLWAAASNRKLFMRLMQRLRVTRKFGDEGVWEYAFNMGTASVEYVNVRDLENRIAYAGFVKAFSEGGEFREILLDQVRVSELDGGTHLFEMPMIYLSRTRDSLHIEFPFNPQPQKPEEDRCPKTASA
jgi:hypothetical protein